MNGPNSSLSLNCSFHCSRNTLSFTPTRADFSEKPGIEKPEQIMSRRKIARNALIFFIAITLLGGSTSKSKKEAAEFSFFKLLISSK